MLMDAANQTFVLFALLFFAYCTRAFNMYLSGNESLAMSRPRTKLNRFSTMKRGSGAATNILLTSSSEN